MLIFAAIGLRRLLSFEKNPPIQSFIDANLIPKFIQYLSRHDLPKLQFEAAWCLTNVASGSYQHVQVLLGKGTIDAFVQLLASPHVEVIEQSIWGLGNLAGDGPKIRDLVIGAGAVEPISVLLDQSVPGSTFTRNASWTLSNLCRGRPAPQYNKV
jgi:importin subunit alpha-1